jgi:hypothetical protein
VRGRIAALVAGALCAAAPAAADVYDDNLAAASRGLGDIVVVGRGANGAIYARHLAGGAWTSWASLGGAAMSGPAAPAYGDSIHVFVTGTDGAVHENVLRGGAWSGWAGLGGVATSAPAAIARLGTSILDVAVRGTDIRRKPYVRRLRLHFPAGKRGRVYARAFYTRKGSRKLRRSTVWRHFTMCG